MKGEKRHFGHCCAHCSCPLFSTLTAIGDATIDADDDDGGGGDDDGYSMSSPRDAHTHTHTPPPGIYNTNAMRACADCIDTRTARTTV